MNLVNLTDHDIIVNNDKGELITIPVSGTTVRVDEIRESFTTDDGIMFTSKRFGDVLNLPEPKPGTVYIVSSKVVEALRGKRGDVVAPDNLVRDNNGTVI